MGHKLNSPRENLEEGTFKHLHVLGNLNRVVRTYNKTQLLLIHISRVEVILKSHQCDKSRLIIDLSCLKGDSIDDGIAKTLCSLTYSTVNDTIQKILEVDCHTLLVKANIRRAFRLLPVHPIDKQLLSTEWQKNIFIDTRLTFQRCAPKVFNILADLLSSLYTCNSLCGWFLNN